MDADPINAAFNAVVAAAGPESGPAPLLDLSSETPKAETPPLVDVGDAEAAAAVAGLRPRVSPPASMVCILHDEAAAQWLSQARPHRPHNNLCRHDSSILAAGVFASSFIAPAAEGPAGRRQLAERGCS